MTDKKIFKTERCVFCRVLPGWSLALLLAVFLAMTGVGAETISNCANISEAGVYVLNQSIIDSGAAVCINIISSNVTFDGSGFTVDGTDSWTNYGIYVYDPSAAIANVTVKNVTVSDWYHGIYYYNVSGGSVTDSTAASNTQYGIRLDYSGNIAFSNNVASSNNQAGIYVYYSNGTTVSNSNASSNSGNGIYLYYSNCTNLTGNTAGSNTGMGTGIYLVHSDRNVLSSNDATSNDRYGICLESSSNYNALTGNAASNNSDYGFYLTSSNNNTLSYNAASNNSDYGIYLSSSSNNTLAGNNVTSNAKYGLSISSSDGNTLANNSMSGNKYNFQLEGYGDQYLNNSIGTSNTVDGKPIYYVKDATNAAYNASTNAGTFYCIWCNNVNITNLNLTKNGRGVSLWKTNNSRVENSNITLNGMSGIYLYSSAGNLVYNNYFNNSYNYDFGGEIYANDWNITKTNGTNIIGGPYLGGNYWANMYGTGQSEQCDDDDGDDICDPPYSPYNLATNNTDYLPLTYN